MTGDARQLIKEGKITAVYPERHSARCKFDDKDGLISAEMPILIPCSSGNKFYALPEIGDTVICLFASNADNTGTGWIIGSRFHDKAKPPENSKDITEVKFSDGTFIKYDRSSHEMRIKCTGKLFIDAEEIHLNDGD